MNADYELIKNIERSIPCFDDYIAGEGCEGIEYPLDNEVRRILFEQIASSEDADNFEIYKRIEEVKGLWATLIKK